MVQTFVIVWRLTFEMVFTENWTFITPSGFKIRGYDVSVKNIHYSDVIMGGDRWIPRTNGQ